MIHARTTLGLLTLLLLLPSSAFATWSVLAVDRDTGRVVIAAASCVNTTDEAMKAKREPIPSGLSRCSAPIRVFRAASLAFSIWREVTRRIPVSATAMSRNRCTDKCREQKSSTPSRQTSCGPAAVAERTPPVL
jgi:hypothetical protein